MHQLRRSFCKSWWNDRWRGFLHAFINLAAKGEDAITLPVGGGRSIQISACPITFIAPYSLNDQSELIEDEEIKLDENVNLENIFDEESLIQYDEDME